MVATTREPTTRQEMVYVPELGLYVPATWGGGSLSIGDYSSQLQPNFDNLNALPPEFYAPGYVPVNSTPMQNMMAPGEAESFPQVASIDPTFFAQRGQMAPHRGTIFRCRSGAGCARDSHAGDNDRGCQPPKQSHPGTFVHAPLHRRASHS